MAKVEFRRDGEVGEIALTDPPLNLFSLELAREMMGAVDTVAESGVRAVLVRAEGAAGFEVAMACDMIWAAEGSQLGLVEGVIRATPFGGGTQRLVARAGAGRAAEAVLAARIYPAETMLEWGVVNRGVAAPELLEKARSLAARLAAGPTLAHAATKRFVRRRGRPRMRLDSGYS